MFATVFSVVAQVANYLVTFDPIRSQFGYLWNHDSNFEKLKNEVENLETAKDRVQRKVNRARHNMEEIRQNVEEWLEKVNKIIDEAGKLIEDEDKANNNCFMGLCLNNLKTCCGLSKEASRKLEGIAGLLQEEERFDEVYIPEEIWLTSTKDYEAFESRKSTLKSILDSLRDPCINRIGVYGLPGVGKTTLAEEVGRRSKKDKLFDEVVFVEVSKTPDIKKIQEAIADKLDLEFGKETERAKRLHARLKNEKKILIILDNIWEDLDFETIGIPWRADQGGCKVLLTTRGRGVLDIMGAVAFSVGILNEKEAWNLFIKKMADDNIEKQVAIDVVKECGGLPIAIITIASALRHKSKFVWQNVLRELRRPSSNNFNGVLAKAYAIVEVSYNNLRGEEHKKLFLLCSLMGQHALTSDLVKYSMGLDMLQDIYTMEEARVKVNTLVQELKDSCLLFDSLNNEMFSMHDFVREVAISIACRDEHVFTVRNEVKWEWPHKDPLKFCTKIYICESDTSGLIEGLECPKLEFFYMNTEDLQFVKIPENFFTRMTNLKVLDLTGMKLPSLPSSIQLLANLQTLCLDQCILGDITLIGNLTKLEILSFIWSDIIELPVEIGRLTKLRLLDLTNCSKLKVISPDVLTSLSQLEELYMGNTNIQWEVQGLNTERSNANLEELKDLSRLTTIEIHIKEDNILPKGFFSRRLERYNICIGDEWDWSRMNGSSRTLKLKLNSNILLEGWQGMKNVEELYLDELNGVKNVLYELDDEGFPQLKHLYIQNNSQFLCVVDSMDMVHCDAFPLLESLFLSNMINLEKIWHGQFTTKSLCNLKIIEVKNCPKLKNIIPLYVAKGLPQLQTIEVTECPNMEEVLSIGEEDEVSSNEATEKIEFRRLRVLTLNCLPKFTSFCSKVKTCCTPESTQKKLTTETWSSEIISENEFETPTSLFDERVGFSNLESLELYEMNFEKIWHNQLPEIFASCLQNLTRLIVHNCDNLKYIFSSSMVRHFEQLQHLEIGNCAILEEIVASEGEEEAVARFVFPRVTSLILIHLPELRTFYPGIHSSDWPMLQKLEVYGCDKVKIFAQGSARKQENNDISTQQSLFSCKKVNPDLEELKLSGEDAIMISQGEDLFRRLRVLQITNDESTNFPIRILWRFNHLEELGLLNSLYEEIFSYGEGGKHIGMLKQIKTLMINGLPNLKHLWKQDPNEVYSNFQYLEILGVWECDNLINLVPSSASFKNLTALGIWHCGGLTYLVSSSTAKSLVRLRELSVHGCKMMTEIIANGESDLENDEIVFNKLQLLDLGELQSLTSFYSGNYNLKFPCLKELVVEKCHKMKIFSRVLSTPSLQKVQSHWDDHEGCWESDLNTTIQQLCNEVDEMSISYVDGEEEDGEGSDKEED